jgi:N-acetylglucosaminyldiphosphoundecaprenol N-acetyl-beta-D-mannosaminyltransferase
MIGHIDIHGLQISNATMEEAISAMKAMLAEDRFHAVYTPNAEMVMQAVRDPELAVLLNGADLLLADGAGVVLGSKILGNPLKEKVSGIDAARGLLRSAASGPLSFYLFGGKPGIAEKAAGRILSEYPGASIAGSRSGYFEPGDEPAIANEINRTRPDILFVCLGAPKQERWIGAHRDKLECRLALGLGGSLDVFAGTVRLAPERMRRMGLEWLFRLAKEPRRWRRMLDLPRFILLTVRVRIFGKNRN